MRCNGKAALLVALAMALWGHDAKADDEESQGERPVADIVNEARARVEGLSKEQRERLDRENENKKKKGFYYSIGMETYEVPVDEVYGIRAAQRASAPIQFLQEMNDEEEAEGNHYAWNMALGYEVNSWLSLELTMHQMDSFTQWSSMAPAIDTSLTDTRGIEAWQSGLFKERGYSITAMPRWNIHKRVAVYARLGLGYAENSLTSKLMSRGYSRVSKQCDADGVSNCRDVFDWVERDLGRINEKYKGYYPIGGVGVSVFDGFFNLEYMYRFNEPWVGGTTLDHGVIYGRFLIRGRWF